MGAAPGVIMAIIINHHISSMMIQWVGVHAPGCMDTPPIVISAMRWGKSETKVMPRTDMPVPAPAMM